MSIRAIFLDMDHTLCDTASADQLGLVDFKKELAQIFESVTASGIGEEYLKIIYGKNSHLPGWRKEAGENEVQYRARLLGNAVLKVAETRMSQEELLHYAKMFMELRIKHFFFFSGVREMLSRLRSNYKLILVTNGPLFSQEPKIEKVKMGEHVDEIILGGLLKYEKPHPSIFELACQKAHCSPGQALHVGDKLNSDIQGANDYGITSVWVNPGKDVVSPKPKPAYMIKHVCELQNLLAQINNLDRFN